MSTKLNHITRIVVLCLIVLFFFPTFTVSCSGSSKDITAIGIVGGYESQGYDISDPAPVVLLLLAFPIIALVILLMKNLREKVFAYAVAAICLANFIGWIVLKSNVKEYAESYSCDFDVTFSYYLIQLLNIVAVALPLVATFGLLENNVKIDNLPKFEKINLKGGPVWKCPGCGGQVPLEVEFCKDCGTKRPEDVVIPAPEEKTESGDFIFCSNCGKKLSAGAKFCTSCGNKIEE